MKKNRLNLLLIIVVTLIVLVFALKDDFLEKILYLLSFNIWWLLLGIIFVILYWVGKALVIYYCVKKFNPNYKFSQAFNLLLGSQFVNGVTPFSVGGQPYQIYKLKKQGLSLEQGTNVAIQDFIVYQISLILLGTIAIIVNNIMHIFPDSSLLKQLVLLGYIINVVVILILFVIAFNQKGNRFLLKLGIKIGAKLKIIKNKEQFLNKLDTTISDFHQSAAVLMKSKIHFIKIIIINFFALVFLYLIPFALIKGLNLDIDLFTTVISSAYVMLIGSFVPIPGGSGGLEYSFVEFYGNFITGAKLSSIMIAWRFITYYLGLIVGAIAINTKEEKS